MALYYTRASRFWLTGYAEEEYALDGPISKFNSTVNTFVVPVVFAEADLTATFNSDATSGRTANTSSDLTSEFVSLTAAKAIRNVFSSIGMQFDVVAEGEALILVLAETDLNSISALTTIPQLVAISNVELDSVFSESVLALRQPRSDYRTIQVIEEDRTVFIDQETRTLIVLEEDRTLHIYGVYS